MLYSEKNMLYHYISPHGKQLNYSVSLIIGVYQRRVSPQMLTPCWVTWKPQTSMILMSTSHSVLGISVRVNQDGQSSSAGCFQLFTISTESCSFLVSLLCHLSSLCVAVFSLLPSFSCLLLPVTCTPSTSSLISIHAARQAHHSGRMLCVNMRVSVCDFHFISGFIFIFS